VEVSPPHPCVSLTIREPGSDDLVFPAPDGDYLDDMAVRRAFVKALKAAGLRKVRFHDLWHTFGTVAASSGMAPVALQAYMGHASYRTTERYLHHAPAVKDAAPLTAAFGGEGAQNAPANASTPITMNRPHIPTNA
jgi:integrase